MLKNVLSLGSILNKEELKSVNGAAGFEICNWEGDPVICKTGHCIQDVNGNWGCR